MLAIAYGARLRAINIKENTLAKLTAEAGYEKAVRWLSEQEDPISVLSPTASKAGEARAKVVELTSDIEDFPNTSFVSRISFNNFFGSRPVYHIQSCGYSGKLPHGSWKFTRVVDADVIQAICGWDMGRCETPRDEFTTIPVRFSSEANDIAIPIHINAYDPEKSTADIYIDLTNRPPPFRQPVYMAESRYKWGRIKDKYSSIINFFQGGIYFDQNNSKISWTRNNDTEDTEKRTCQNSIRKKVNRFINSTKPEFNFSRLTGKQPRINDNLKQKQSDPNHINIEQWVPAVQLEFYVERTGMVRITNNCAVACIEGGNYDYMLNFVDPAKDYKKYNVYAYHYADSADRILIGGQDPRVTDTYVSEQAVTPSQTVNTPLGGQIYVDGNVIIGGLVRRSDGRIYIDGNWENSSIRGRITIVATGNIWIVSPINYDNPQNKSSTGFPIPNARNLNALGLFSQFGVVKVVDPALSAGMNDLKYYRPVASPNDPNQQKQRNSPKQRSLPEPMVVQAVITAAGGGFGVENVENRKERINSNNFVVAGAITEVVRGLAKDLRSDCGFKKHYYFDKRLLNGILPGDLWLQSKYAPTPGGWRDWQR
ncbi:MAG: hypothetical protein ACYSSL_06535 [Planctomycetota bacterium]